MKTVKIDTDHKNLISLLTSEQFYDSPDIFLRELLQNAYDACYTRQALEWSWGTEFLELEDAERVNSVRRPYEGKIVVSYNSANGMLFVEDNGIGMNESDLTKFVAHVGSSYYTSDEFKNQRLKYEPVSQFGIGLCSCFRVSRAILIESKKDKTINTAWNVMNKQSLEPIAAKWFNGADDIEYINSNRAFSGTRVTLALQPKYAMNMTLSYLVNAVGQFMACQPIPIEIYFDKKKEVLFQTHLEMDSFAYVRGITTLHVDNEWMEGYLTLYNSKHKSLIGESELYQQYFRILDDRAIRMLKPEWLRHMMLRINLKKRMLNLKMTRDGVAQDENFKKLREAVGQLVIGYFQKNPLSLGQYLEDGQRNILSEYEAEMQVVQQAAYIHVYLKDQDIELLIDTVLNGFLGKEIRIAYISHKLFGYFQDNFSVDFKAFLGRYQLIVFEKNRDMFTQFLTPYLKVQQYVISEIPGLVYTELVADIRMKKNISPYRKSVRLHPPQLVDDVLFCFATNEQTGPLQIILNENNRNALMLERASGHPKVANLKEVIIENIKQRIINSKKSWDKLIDFGGSFIDEWTSENAITVQSIWCLEDDFAVSLNEFIREKLTMEELVEYGLEGLVFHKEEFISWWYMPR
ncbi:MAG: ATP-binding protein [Agathobacter sp.]|nr:ATP-binding protein [Agathobacter sp.]